MDPDGANKRFRLIITKDMTPPDIICLYEAAEVDAELLAEANAKDEERLVQRKRLLADIHQELQKHQEAYNNALDGK